MLIRKEPNGEFAAYTDAGRFISVLPPDYPGMDRCFLERRAARDEEVWRTTEEGKHFKFESTTGEIKAGFGGRFNGKKLGSTWGSGLARASAPKPAGKSQSAGSRGRYWLHNLPESKLLEATKEIGAIKSRMKQSKNTVENWNRLAAQGMLTYPEVDDLLKRYKLDKFDENMTPEEYVMKCDRIDSRARFVDLLGESKNWKENAERLKRENLSEEERKVCDYLEKKLESNQINPQGKEPEVLMDLKSKAMGGPTSGEAIPDKILRAAGAKEPPAPVAPAAPAKADYSWYQPTRGGNMEAYFADVVGDKVSYGHNYTQEEFMDMNQRFLDKIKHGKLTPNELSYYAMSAVSTMRARMGASPFSKPGPEMLARVTPEEKKQMLDFVNRFASFAGSGYGWVGRFSQPSFDDFSQITFEDFKTAEKFACRLNGNKIRSKEAQQPLRDYILAQEKMMIGAVPTDKQAFEKAQTELAEKELREAMEKVTATPERKEELRQGKTTAIGKLESKGVTKLPVGKLPTQLSHEKIVSKVGGPDQTRGSCLSVALTYVANKLGFDVLDFRDGDSRSVLSELTTMQDLANTPGVDGKIELQKNEFKSVEKFFGEMEIGKEYILSCGRHCAVVRKNDQGVPEYLELQSYSWKNGFHPFEGKNGKDTLKKRFSCQTKYGSQYGHNYMRPCVLIEVDKLRGCKGFENALEYINTNEEKQRKGAGGGVK